MEIKTKNQFAYKKYENLMNKKYQLVVTSSQL